LPGHRPRPPHERRQTEFGDLERVDPHHPDQAEYSIARYLALPILEWLSAHRDAPIEDLKREIRAVPEPSEWAEMLAALDEPDPAAAPPYPHDRGSSLGDSPGDMGHTSGRNLTTGGTPFSSSSTFLTGERPASHRRFLVERKRPSLVTVTASVTSAVKVQLVAAGDVVLPAAGTLHGSTDHWPGSAASPCVFQSLKVRMELMSAPRPPDARTSLR